MAKKTVDQTLIKSANLFPVVGIGASAGGLDAFKKLLRAIPVDSGMAYVLVQHLDPSHESMLPEILQKVTKIPVLEITDDIKVLPDHIYVIPSNKMMVATDGILLLAPRPEKSKTERNLPIDLFFKSLAEVHQEHAIGVVLSGTASDGTQGLKAIKEQGGITFAQDEASAEYEGMPHSAAEAGVVDFILPPEEIPNKLLEVINKTILSDEELQNIPKQDEDVFKQILSLLRIRKGVDFTYYKQTTIRRRILRRILINKNEEPTEYLKFLRGSTAEQDLLYQDLLIPVTSFFRDKKTFDNLCNIVFPAIVKNKIPGEITRLWVAGCSTGQEVYSFAICFKEFLGDNHERIQIFGTDLSEPAITKARTGMYETNELDNVSPERLKEYFTKNNGGYQVNKSIRDLCVFAHHNFLKDPPFGKMDCISCRNVLIYMEPYLQKKALTTFHYALNPKGFLLLGKSETTSGVPDLFASASKIDKLYSRKDVPGRFMQVASERSEQILNRPANSSKSENLCTDFQKTADDILLTKYTPAGVVVNEMMDIVHFRGNTANYLEQAPGKPSHNLLIMAKNGLGFELRNILHKAKTVKVTVVKENIPLSVNGNLRHISIEAVPLPNTVEPYYLILFHDNNLNDIDSLSTRPGGISNKKKVSAKTKKDEKDIRIQLLEQELAQAREDMRSITEDQEASNEELQSANEELLSGSEELQSLNEELETSKEELQSTNEELTVLNHELVGLNEEVTDARNYSESIVATLYQPLLVLDKHLRVKTANKAFYKTFNVGEQETEGVLVYDLGNRQWNIPELRTLLEEILPQKKQITDFEVTHNFTSIGERVILLNALEITREKKEEKLILLSIEDITQQRLFQLKEKKILSRYHNLLLQTPVAIAIYRGRNYIVELVNDLALKILVKDKNLIGKPLFESMPELESQLKPTFDKVMQSGIPFHANEYEATLIRNGKNEQKYFDTIFEPILEDDNTISGVIVVAHEVTDQVLARKQIEDSEHRYHEMIYTSPSLIAIFKGEDMIIEIANDAILESWGKGKDVIGQSLFEVIPESVEQGFDKLLLSVYKTGKPFHAHESPITLLRNGIKELVYYDFIYQAQRNVNGVTEGVAVIASEVTSQALLHKKIKESEAFNRAVLESSPDCIKMLDGDGRLEFINSNGVCLLEIDDFKSVQNTYWWDLWQPENQQIIKDAVAKAKGGEKVQFQIFSSTSKGTPKWWDIIVFPVQKDGTGNNLRRILSVSRDITEQKKVEEVIRENETRFRSITNASTAALWMSDENFQITYVNQTWINWTGQPFEKHLGEGWLKSILPEDQEIIRAHIVNDSTARRNFKMDFRVKWTDGTIHWCATEGAPRYLSNGQFAGYAGTCNDITERKQNELKEKELLTRFQKLVIQAPVAICVLRGKDYIIEVINKGMYEMWDRKIEDVINKPAFDVLPEFRDQGLKELLDNVLNTGEPIVIQELPLTIRRHDSMENIFVKFVYEPLREADGTISGVMALAHEITEQVLSRKKVEESEKQFRQMAELMPQKIWTADAEGNKNYFNQTLLDYVGFTFEELKGSGWQKIVHPDDWKKNKSQWEESLSTGQDYEIENRLLRKDGEYLWHLTRAVALKDDTGAIKMWIGAKTEIQKIKEEEERKGDFMKMVSHELKTPVTSIKGYVQLLLSMLKDTPEMALADLPLLSSLTRIDIQVLRLTRLITEMLDLTRLETGMLELKKEFFSLNELVNETVADIIYTNTKHTIHIHTNFTGRVYGDKDRLGQVLINLINNAIKYSTHNNPIDVTILQPGNNLIAVSVKDYGIGITKTDQLKIFERFFRAGGKSEHTYSGFGIGLYIANQIIERHKGSLSVESEKEKGSTFTFTLHLATANEI